MSENQPPLSAHITRETTILPALRLWEIYLADRNRSPYTVKAFANDIQLLASYFPPDKNLGSISTNDLNHFLQWLQKGRGIPCSPKSLARRITSIKSFFRWLQLNGITAVDPAEKVVQQSVISPTPEVLTIEEESMVIDAAQSYRTAGSPDARPYALLSLLLATGIKKGECLAISKNHIDLETQATPVLFIRYSNPQYRYKERKIELPSEWRVVYEEYLAQYKPEDQVFPWSPRRLEYLLEEIGNKAGLGSKHLSFDMCRWTCALNDKLTGIPTDQIRQKLGISKIQWREVNMKLNRLAEAAQVPPISTSTNEPLVS